MDGDMPIGRIRTVCRLIDPPTPVPAPVVSVALSPPPSVNPMVLLMDTLLFNWIAGLMFACSIVINKFSQRNFHFHHSGVSHNNAGELSPGDSPDWQREILFKPEHKIIQAGRGRPRAGTEFAASDTLRILSGPGYRPLAH